MKVQQVPAQIFAAGNAVARVNTLNPDGTPLDVHTGYTLASASIVLGQDANPQWSGGIDISSHLTPTFDATGFNLLIDCEQLRALLPAFHVTANIMISNDGGSTSSTAAALVIAMNSVGGAL
jgi:hypothetical protein